MDRKFIKVNLGKIAYEKQLGLCNKVLLNNKVVTVKKILIDIDVKDHRSPFKSITVYEEHICAIKIRNIFEIADSRSIIHIS